MSVPTDARRRFLDLLGEALRLRRVVRLSMSRHRGDEPDLLRVLARPIVLKGQPNLSFTWRYRTRDVTKNLPDTPALALVDSLLGTAFESATLQTSTQSVEFGLSKRGRALIRTTALRSATLVPDAAGTDAAGTDAAGSDAAGSDAAGSGTGSVGTDTASADSDGSDEPGPHNRERDHPIPQDRPFLAVLGVTDTQGRVVPAMARKWRQINKFVEVFVGAWRASGLPVTTGSAVAGRPLRIVDFGAGKGYLTFALYDHLVNDLGQAVSMTGVERRADLVRFCNAAAADLGFGGLTFRQGGIDDRMAAEPVDVMIALHACDTATDDALATGVGAGASILICSPCCHKELRPQLLSPHPLRAILQHGIHQSQQAEMLTDGLRALLLQTRGYDARVFEFVSPEHTSMNKMILAVRRDEARRDARAEGQARQQADELMVFYGIRRQRLDALLGDAAVAPPSGVGSAEASGEASGEASAETLSPRA